MRADQTRGGSDQVRIVPCRLTIWQQRDVLEPGTDAMASLQSTLIDCPTRDAVTVVNLLQRYARGHHDLFHLGSVLDSRVRIVVKRLDKDTPTPARQAGTDESSRILNAQ